MELSLSSHFLINNRWKYWIMIDEKTDNRCRDKEKTQLPVLFLKQDMQTKIVEF